MHRRSILSLVAATVLAGCGWSQETRDIEDPASLEDTDQSSDDDDTSDNDEASEDEQTPEQLPESEAGDTLIEDNGEQLLLPADRFLNDWAQVDSWEELDIESTNPCRRFEGGGFRETVRECEYCVIVAEDEDAARAELQTFADISGKKTLPRTRGSSLEEQDVGLEIGNEAVVHAASRETGNNEDERVVTRTRIVFRDTNVVGTVDYTERTWTSTDFEVRDVRDVADLAAAFHGYWREE